MFLPDLPGSGLHLLGPGPGVEVPEVDADGKAPRPKGASVRLDAEELPLPAGPALREESLEALEEVAQVPLGLEGQESVVQQGLHHLSAPGELQEDVRGGEGDVEEEGALVSSGGLLQRRRQGDQVVVVDPEEVLLPGMPLHHPGELAVHLQVGPPVLRLEAAAGLEVVEEGPDDLVGEPLVEEPHLLLREEHRQEPVAAGCGGGAQDGLDARQVDEVRGAHPADPLAPPVPQDGRQGGHQSPRSGADGPVSRAPLQDHRKPVGHHDQPCKGMAHDLGFLLFCGRVQKHQLFRNASTSSGGRIQARARVDLHAGRTSTDNPRVPRVAKARSSVRSSPR